jgi:cellulose synthase/poly-beta-1,6-N-acetylglucosamine synthase-like glycosyltransferase
MITIGIPAHNEQNTIEKIILQIVEQVSTKDEIIVIADGCTDLTIPIVEKISGSQKQVKLIIERERKGKASAINTILKLAKGDIIVQIDADIELTQHSINQLIKHFTDPKVGGVSARSIPIIPKNNLFHDYTIISYQQVHERRLRENKAGTHWHLGGALCAYRKEALDIIPLNIKGAVDYFIGLIVRSKGYQIIYEPKVRVYKKTPLTIRDFFREKARIIAGFYQLKWFYGREPSVFNYIPTKTMTQSKSRKFDSFLPPFLPVSFLPSFIPSFIISKHFLFIALTYFFSWLYGWWLIRSRKPLAVVWKRIDSTK